MEMLTRTTPFDHGAGDGLYYASTSSVYIPYNTDFIEADYLNDKYTLGQANATTPRFASPPIEGYQQFGSTKKKRPLYNACKNVKFRGFSYPYGITFQRYNRANTGYVFPYQLLPLPDSSYLEFSSEAPNMASAWGASEGASRRAWWNMQPRFEGRVSLLNSIFELKDFRDIAKFALRVDYSALAFDARNLSSWMKKTSRKLNLDPSQVTVGMAGRIFKGLDVTTRGLAGLILTKELAIDPTIADVLMIHAQMARTAREAQAAFKKRGDLPNRSHFSEVISQSEDVDSSASNYNNYWKKLLKSETVRFTATMEYLFDYRDRPELQAFRRYWGLDLNAEVVWNALPLSFIFDYFIAIGDSLHAMSPDPNVDLQFTQYCESVELKRKAGYYTVGDSRVFWLKANGVMSDGSQSNIPLAGYELSSYERRVGVPTLGPALPRVKLPTTRQARILASLVRCWI